MSIADDLVSLQTGGIVVSAGPVLVDEEAENRYMWGYYLCIENNSNDKIQILSKEFNITDDRGNSYLENGLGFNGEIPELEPGEYFEFSDSAPINSAYAVLYGTCRIVKEKCNQIKDIKIPAVNLIGNINYDSSVN